MSNPDEYTVGWISALRLEGAAARLFLDAVHVGPEYVSATDTNSYILGKMGKFNVAIALLPNGEYGTTAATDVATNMLSTFRKLRICLLVGIGGGAPSEEHDIRLGDVVVSAPRGGTGGVIQYDLGKNTQGEPFHRTGHRNQPPGILLKATSLFDATYDDTGPQLQTTIDSIIGENPRRQKYKRPNLDQDRLHKAGVLHAESCVDGCGKTSSNLKIRRPRTDDEDNPAIHYGVIASANQLMKNAIDRDMFAKCEKVLCFEMEAAGLMNTFPCLVIRGICDYSDSHKSDEWQSYAAMTATAYAKALLALIPPNTVEAEANLQDKLSAIEKKIDKTDKTSQDTREDVRMLKTDHERERLTLWLSPCRPSTNYKNAQEECYEGTGLWFLRCKEYIEWKTQKSSFIWLHGRSGYGKTVLSSTIIRNLVDKSTEQQPLLYFYFDFRDAGKQTVESMVRSLIAQLYSKRKESQGPLDSLFLSSSDDQPTCQQLRVCLLAMIQQVEEVWIVLDGLDECTERTEDEGVISAIEELHCSTLANVHLLATSQPLEEIESQLLQWTTSEERIEIRSDMIADDVRAYVNMKVSKLERWETRTDIQDRMVTGILKKADGMFRMAACLLESFKKCLSPLDVNRTLASLPTTLSDIYGRMLQDIPPEHHDSAKRILQFLVYSRYPLRLEELGDALVVNITEESSFDPGNRMPVPREIARYCSKLVVLVAQSSQDRRGPGEVLQLAHLSVKQYLVSKTVEQSFEGCMTERNAAAVITRVCLTYLAYLDGLFMNRLDRIERYQLDDFHLAGYAVLNWMEHARICDDRDIQVWILEFFLEHGKGFAFWEYRLMTQVPEEDLGLLGGQNLEKLQLRQVTPLCYASLRGLFHVVKSLLKTNAVANAPAIYQVHALQSAAHNGHEAIVKLLLDEGGVEVNGLGGYYGTALQTAAHRSKKAIVKILLERGADVDAHGGYYGNALQAAAWSGNEAVVKLLLKHGANINVESSSRGSALQAAARSGNEAVVELLLKHGADVNAKGGVFGHALHAAVGVTGNRSVVKLLLDAGADVDALGGDYGDLSALQVAAQLTDNELVIKLLLEFDAEVNAQGGDSWSALHSAVEIDGNEAVVKLLLENGADVNAKGGFFGTALQTAMSLPGGTGVARLLLKAGADMDGLSVSDRSRAHILTWPA